jgi:hypothetical protein
LNTLLIISLNTLLIEVRSEKPDAPIDSGRIHHGGGCQSRQLKDGRPFLQSSPQPISQAAVADGCLNGPELRRYNSICRDDAFLRASGAGKRAEED